MNEYYGEAGATHSLPEFQTWLETRAQVRSDQDKLAEGVKYQQPAESSAPTELPMEAQVGGEVQIIDTWFRHAESKPGPKFCIDLAHQVRGLATLLQPFDRPLGKVVA